MARMYSLEQSEWILFFLYQYKKEPSGMQVGDDQEVFTGAVQMNPGEVEMLKLENGATFVSICVSCTIQFKVLKLCNSRLFTNIPPPTSPMIICTPPIVT